jgi:hypothetical protein
MTGVLNAIRKQAERRSSMSITSPRRPSDIRQSTREPTHRMRSRPERLIERSELGAERTAPGADARPTLRWTLDADGRLVCAWQLERPAQSSELPASACEGL